MSESTPSKPQRQAEGINGSVDLPDIGATVGDGRRRTGYAILALACAAGLGLMLVRHGPRSASASGITPANSDAALSDLLAADVAGVRQMDAALSGSEKVIAGFRFAPARAQVPPGDLRVNPFRAASSRGAADESAKTPRPEQDR